MTVFVVFINDQITKVFATEESADKFAEDWNKRHILDWVTVTEWSVE